MRYQNPDIDTLKNRIMLQLHRYIHNAMEENTRINNSIIRRKQRQERTESLALYLIHVIRIQVPVKMSLNDTKIVQIPS